MTRTTIPINRHAIAALGAFAVVMALPKAQAIVTALGEPTGGIGGPIEEMEPQEIPPIPDPSSAGMEAMGNSIQTRATYLLDLAQKSGDAFAWVNEREATVLGEANAYRASLGIFAGDAGEFAKLSNLSAELAAVELVRHWLMYPTDRNTLPALPLNQPLEQFIDAGDTGYGSQW
jgi:hypothetical protein